MIPVGLCQCGCGAKTELAPNTSRRNGWVKGEPLKFIRFHHAKVQFNEGPSAYERIMCRVVKMPDGCWDAGPDTGRETYGQVSKDGRNVRCHQVVWEHHNGPVPPGKVIRHRCDNRRCCNPSHLELGSPADNVQDAVSRGRIQMGESRYNSKLTESDVVFIRTSTLSGKGVAALLSVSKATVSQVRSGKVWRHLL